MAVVYLATNLVNGKRYVGATISALEKRMREHKCAAKRNIKKEKGIAFYKAIRKYGFDNFKFSILIECEDEKVFFEEIRMVALLKPEYNMTLGGEGNLGLKMSDYCRQKLEEGRNKNRDKINKTLSAMGKTKESRERFAKYQALGPKAMAKKVVCLDNGCIYESASAASRFYGIEKSMVSEVCQRKKTRYTAGGKVFRYFGDHYGGAEEALRVKMQVKANKAVIGAKQVLCVEDNKIFSSTAECARFYKVCAPSIGSVCNGKYKTCKGKHFVFYIGVRKDAV